MKKSVFSLVLLFSILVGCSSEEGGESTETGQTKSKIQEKVSNSPTISNESIQAKLVVLDNQPALKDENMLALLNSSMEANPTIEAGVVDIIPLEAQYVDEKLAILFFLRNGTENEIQASDLESLNIVVKDVSGKIIAEEPLKLLKDAVGTLKKGEVRVLRYDILTENIVNKEYDFTKGYIAEIK